MNAWANTVLTDAGRALLAKLTEGNTLNITGAFTGSGFVTPGLLSKQTEVTDGKQSLFFKPVTYPETGKCAITAVLKNKGVTDGYTATQVGIYAGEILLFISQASDANSGTIIPSETEMPGYSAEWTFYFQYGQADGVEVVVDPTGAVSRQEMEQYVAVEMKNHTHTPSSIGAAPISHAHDSTTFGLGTDTKYGHVKLSDATDSTEDINEGVAATPAAVKATYDYVRTKAPTNHASANTNYGTGTGVLFGHVQLSDATDDQRNSQNGVAATPAAVRKVYILANGKAPAHSYGTEDLTAGSSPLETGKLYLVYE